MEKRKIAVSACTMVFLLIGCTDIKKNNVDFTGITDYKVSDAVKKIEVMNIYNDATVFSDIYKGIITEANTLKDKSLKENLPISYGLINQYVLDVYKLAVSRVVADIGTIYTDSEEYMSYIAMLQKFSEKYDNEKDTFQKMISEGKKEVYNTETYRMLEIVEDYYLDILKYNTDENK